MGVIVFLSILCCVCVLGFPVDDGVNKLPIQTDGPAVGRGAGVRDRDPDAIVYPDDITRDSYGNPVTPFTLPDDHHTDIGHMTDINKDNKLDNRASFNATTTTKDPSGFIIPSYAGGIMKVETLLPNAPKFPLVPPTKKDSSNNNRNVYDNKISNDILPPYRDNEQKVEYPRVEVNTQATIFFPDSNFLNQIATHNRVDTKLPPSTTVATTVPQTNFNTQKVQTRPPTTTTRTTAPPMINHGDIYKGGFGGSVGILGNPQPVGWAVKKEQNGQSPPTPSTSLELPKPPTGNAVPSVQPKPERLPTPEPTLLAPHSFQQTPFLDVNLLPPVLSAKPVGVPPVSNNKLPLAPPPSHSSRPAVPPPSNQQQSGTYVGSFGGAPGILRPYDNVRGHTHKSS